MINLIADFHYKLASQKGFHDDDVLRLIKNLYFLSHPFYIRWMKYLTPKGDLDEVAGMRLRKTLLGKNLRDVLLEVGIVNIDSPLGLSINQISIQTNKVSRLAIFLSFFYFTGMPPLFPRPYFTNLLREVPKDILEADEAFQMDLKAIK